MAINKTNHHVIVDCTFNAAPEVNEQPTLRVYRWRVYGDTDSGVLVCEMPETGKIRVTSPIEFWDTETGKLLTESGRVYELVGDQAENCLEFALALMRPGAGNTCS